MPTTCGCLQHLETSIGKVSEIWLLTHRITSLSRVLMGLPQPLPLMSRQEGCRPVRLLMAWLRSPPQVWCHQGASIPCSGDACGRFTCRDLLCHSIAAMCLICLMCRGAPTVRNLAVTRS